MAALGPGELEYMLMRRILDASDNQGPWPLDDREAVEDTLRLMVGNDDHYYESVEELAAVANAFGDLCSALESPRSPPPPASPPRA